jgi:1,2-diacylglycerol 3-alpha-glucosyltransferase
MRIGMMADAYKPHVSGVTNYISLSKQHLESRGHQVYVFTFRYEDYTDDEANIIRSPGLPLLDTGFQFSPVYSKEARHLLRTMDVAHVHHPFLSGPLTIAFCRARAIPIIFTNHTRYDLYSQAYLPGMPDAISLQAVKTYLPLFCRSCDLVISPSPGMKNVLENLGVDVPVEVVPNGIDLRPFQNIQTPVTRSSLGFAKEDVVLIYVGRLGPEKNLAYLMRSFAGTCQAYDHVKLLVVGDGPERSNLEDQAARAGITGRVHFAGLVPYDQVPRYMAMADAFVTASITEVHPLTVIEAMAVGLPVLGIVSPGIADTVQDGETGYLAQQEDLAGFTAKMVRLSVDHDGRRKMGVLANKAAQTYSINNTTPLMEERYHKVIERAGDRQGRLQVRWTRWLDRIRP